MAWVWFILLLIVLIIEFRAGLKMQLEQQIQQATLAALIAVISDKGVSGEQAANEYIDNILHTALAGDYDKIMTNLCKTNGLTYKKGPDGYTIDTDIKHELARRLGQTFATVAQGVRSSKSDFDDNTI